MSSAYNFTFDGTVDLNTYHKEWQAKLKQLEEELELLKKFEGVPTAGDWGSRFDSVISQGTEGANTGELFKNVHPNKEFRDEGAAADDAFENFHSSVEKDPILASLVQRMTFVNPAIDPHEQRFVQRWQTIYKESGATLAEDKRAQLLSLDKHLTELRTQYSQNINNGQRDWLVSVDDLEGMPEDFMKSHPANEEGHVKLTTRYADVFPVLMYCKSDETRHKTQYEYRARCPENIKILQEIIEGSQAYAQILGYPNYAALSLEGRLALKGLDKVNKFIDNIVAISKDRADQEKQARAQVYGTKDLMTWQASFAKEILSRRLFSGFDSGQLRPYLRVGNVLPQIALLIQELFGVRFQHQPDVKSWTETGVECYDVYDDDDGRLMGRLYTDLHPRDNKYSHACVSTIRKAYNRSNLPEVVLLANVPQGDDALLTYGEVSTLYHEYGHVIHGLCATQSVYGNLNNLTVETDFVEAPSQFLERHMLEPEVLKRLAINKDGQVIPDDLIKKLQDSQQLGDGMQTMTQMTFARAAVMFFSKAMVDGKYPGSLLEDWKDLLEEHDIFGYTEGDCFPATFGHLASTGYGPKYYGYMHAQAICDEFFEAFRAAPGGLLDKEMSRQYRRTILEPGSTKDATEMVTEFLGRPFTLDAFKARISRKLDLSAL